MQGTEEIERSLSLLRRYVEERRFRGWDPYDGLNSLVLEALPVARSNSLVRLAWIQFMKRSPVNLRRLLLVKPGLNPKGLALFVSGYAYLYRAGERGSAVATLSSLADLLVEAASPGYSGACWGYNFPWQSLGGFYPKYEPTVVATSFAGCALLDAYDVTGNPSYLRTAASIPRFLLEDLGRTSDGAGSFCFGYSPRDRTRVYNASLLGSRVLSRLFSYTGERELLRAAKASAEYCCRRQNPDGSWFYGEPRSQHWIDSFHTGYNIECLSEYQRYSGDVAYAEALSKGTDYYLASFFTPRGTPKYYHNRTYPVDIHATSQLIITVCRLGLLGRHEELVRRVLSWTTAHMQDPSGYFYYQFRPYLTNRIPYMRWCQAWMFLALSMLCCHLNPTACAPPAPGHPV